jgi:hypothetical protein
MRGHKHEKSSSFRYRTFPIFQSLYLISMQAVFDDGRDEVDEIFSFLQAESGVGFSNQISMLESQKRLNHFWIEMFATLRFDFRDGCIDGPGFFVGPFVGEGVEDIGYG